MRTNYARHYFRLVAMAFFLSCSATVSAQITKTSGLEWREFKSETGGFTIKFPGSPTLQDYPFQKGPLNLTRHAHSLAHESFVFHVEYTDYPKGYVDPSLSLEGGISGLRHTIVNDGGTLLAETSVARENCAGREATFLFQPKRPNHPQFWHARIFLSGHRMYLMIFTADDDSPAARDTGRTFLDSFSVVAGCTSLVAPTAAPSSTPKVEVLQGASDPSGWRKIESPLGFSVLMPGPVTYEAEKSQLEPFPLTHHTFTSSTEPAIYTLEVIGEFPANFRSSEVHFQTAIDLMLSTVKKNLEPAGFRILPLRDLRLTRFPGREFSLFLDKQESSGRMQIYATPTYTYLIIAVVQNSPTSTSSIERFFTSLRISPK